MNQGEQKKLKKLDYENVLISVANPNNAKQLVRLAHLVTTHRATFHIMNVTLKGSFPEAGRSWRRGSSLVMNTTHFARRLGRVAKPLAATSNSIPKSIVNSAREIDADLIVMGWFGRITPVAVRRSSVVNKVLHKAPCDVGVLKSRGDLAQVEKVMIPVGPQKRNEKRLALVKRLLARSGARGELVYVSSGTSTEGGVEQASEYLQEILDLIDTGVETRVISAESVLEGLLSGAREADLVVMGPGREWVFDRFLFGRTADNLTNRVDCSVLMFKASEHKMVAWFRGLLKALGELLKS